MVAVTAAVLTLAGCSSGSSAPSPSGSTSPAPSPSGSASVSVDPTLASKALVTADQVAAIAGSGFTPYTTRTVVSATDPAACLELIRLADGTRTAPPATVSSATVTYADGSTGSSITNTVHVFADASAATKAFDEVRNLVPRCAAFSLVVDASVLKGSITPAAGIPATPTSLGLKVLVTSPTTKADVTSELVLAGRSIVVGVAGTPDGQGEAVWSVKTAALSAAAAASIT